MHSYLQCEKYIKEQLSSILLQLNIEDEIIISDDNSFDSTLDIINNFNDKRIKILNNTGGNLVKNFENAILNSSGDYIFLCDQDDIWEKDKVEVCLSDFNKGFDLILSDCSIFDSDSNKIIHDSFFEYNNSKKGVLNNIVKNSYIGCCMAFNKKVKDKILPFPKNIPMHDSWIGINSELYFKVNFNENKLIKYRRHSANASFTSAGKSKYGLMKKISFRLFLCYALICRFIKN